MCIRDSNNSARHKAGAKNLSFIKGAFFLPTKFTVTGEDRPIVHFKPGKSKGTASGETVPYPREEEVS